MFIPSLRVEWSFRKCTNASSFPLMSALTGFDKLICARVCVCVYTPSPVSPTVQTLSSLTQFLSQHRNEKISTTALCAPFTSPTLRLFSHLGPHPEHPRPPLTGASGVHPPGAAGAFPNRVAARRSSAAEPYSQRGLLFSYCVYISCLQDFCS